MEDLQPLKIFIVYAREDADALKGLRAHFKPIPPSDLKVWYDGEILPGQHWDNEIKTQVQSADIILLLISKDFFDSEYIQTTELKSAIERHKEGKAMVVPVIVRPCVWQDTYAGKFQVLPTNGDAIFSRHWHDPDEALVSVVEGVKKVANKLRAGVTNQERLELIEKQKVEIDNRISKSDKILGNAISEIFDAKESKKHATKGIVRRFLNGSIYMITEIENQQGDPLLLEPGHQVKIDVSSSKVYFGIKGGINIGICYETNGGTGSVLGYPISDIQKAWEGSNSTQGIMQSFQGGRIYFTEQYVARILLNGNIRNKLAFLEGWFEKNNRLKRTGGMLGFPITNEEKIKSNLGSEGSVQRFEDGYIIESKFGTFAVHLSFYRLYQSIDCWNSELGFPSSDDKGIPSEILPSPGSIKYFENGCMTYNKESGLSFVIYGTVYKRWKLQIKKYGFPINIQYILENGSAQQDFEGGTINEADQI